MRYKYINKEGYYERPKAIYTYVNWDSVPLPAGRKFIIYTSCSQEAYTTANSDLVQQLTYWQGYYGNWRPDDKFTTIWNCSPAILEGHHLVLVKFDNES